MLFGGFGLGYHSQVIGTLRPKKVQFFSAIRHDEASKLIESVRESAGRSMEFTEEILAGGFNVVDDLYPSLEFLQGFTGMEAKAEKVVAQINQILDDTINEHKEMGNSETTEEDLVYMLQRLQEDGTFKCPISVSKLVLEFMEWAMKEIMKNPRVVKKAEAGIRGALKGKKTITEELNY
ncbi:hypothetical protein NC651_034709 [Populus alba x Populus x berolinensis]|nr:hypothetical protein NC651_034709 [Populus alba x Populus x berolinensis]